MAPNTIAYVAYSTEGIVVPVELDRQLPHSPIKVGGFPVAVKIDSAGTFVYVVDRDNNAVIPISLEQPSFASTNSSRKCAIGHCDFSHPEKSLCG